MKGWATRVKKSRIVSKAFTLVELLIVVAVIGILAAIIVGGYGVVVANANDASVKADLQKIDDAFKQYALDSGGVFPDTPVKLEVLKLELNKGAYYIQNKANIYVCTNPTLTEYAVIAMAKSGKRFVVKSESGISEYAGSVVWNSTTGNWTTTCSSIDSTYVSLAGNVTGMVDTVWQNWTDAS